jgi:hypothetical protein
MAEGHEDASFIKYTPHAIGKLLLHIFPPFGAWVVVLVVLQEFI